MRPRPLPPDMKPAWYFNLTVSTATASGASASGAGVTALARLVHVLHRLFAKLDGKHALAFPEMRTGAYRHPGNIVRVFGETREQLDTLADHLETQPFVKDYAQVGRIRAVPVGLSSGFTEYRRFRTPGRSSRLQESRATRLKAGDELPYLHMASDSTGQRFSVYIEPIGHSTAPSEDCLPDSYGLSVYERSFALPNIPA